MIKELGLGQQRRVYFLTEGLSSLLTSNRDEINNFAKHTSALASPLLQCKKLASSMTWKKADHSDQLTIVN